MGKKGGGKGGSGRGMLGRRRISLAVGTLLHLRLRLLRTRGGIIADPRTGQARLGRLEP